MQRFLLIAACVLCGNPIAAAREKQPEAVEIPLKEIWAFNMPGTRDVRELEPDHFGENTRKLSGENQTRQLMQSLTEQIRRNLKYPAPQDPDADKGFAILGTGLEALRDAYRVLVEKKKPSQSFPEDSQISIVFFSKQYGSYVRLVKAERTNTTINVQYRFVPHLFDEATSHFALIPLGKVPVGKYRVEMIQLPAEQHQSETSAKYVSTKEVRRIVSRPFSFSVVRRN